MTTLRVLVAAVLATLEWGWRIMWATWRRSPDRFEIYHQAPRRWSGAFIDAARIQVVLEGAENLVHPAVLVSNHESWFDVFALATHLPVDYRFVGKKELARVPIFGPAWQACGHIAIDRSDRKAAIRSLDEAGRRVMDEGAVVILFPEGTRSRTRRMLPFKKGAFMLALKLGVPVIPVGVSGGREIMAPGDWTVRPGTIRIRVGEPIPVEGLGPRDRDELLARARAAVERLRGGEALDEASEGESETYGEGGAADERPSRDTHTP